jgi:hypothetical protein
VQNHYPRFKAGRPPLPASQRTVIIRVSVLPLQKEWAVQLGEGNLAKGVRKALAIAMQATSPELVAATMSRLAETQNAEYAAKRARQEAVRAADAAEDYTPTEAELDILCRDRPDAPPHEGPPPGGWVDEPNLDGSQES